MADVAVVHGLLRVVEESGRIVLAREVNRRVEVERQLREVEREERRAKAEREVERAYWKWRVIEEAVRGDGRVRAVEEAEGARRVRVEEEVRAEVETLRQENAGVVETLRARTEAWRVEREDWQRVVREREAEVEEWRSTAEKWRGEAQMGGETVSEQKRELEAMRERLKEMKQDWERVMKEKAMLERSTKALQVKKASAGKRMGGRPHSDRNTDEDNEGDRLALEHPRKNRPTRSNLSKSDSEASGFMDRLPFDMETITQNEHQRRASRASGFPFLSQQDPAETDPTAPGGNQRNWGQKRKESETGNQVIRQPKRKRVETSVVNPLGGTRNPEKSGNERQGYDKPALAKKSTAMSASNIRSRKESRPPKASITNHPSSPKRSLRPQQLGVNYKDATSPGFNITPLLPKEQRPAKPIKPVTDTSAPKIFDT
eukprot:CAMPEP_0184683376 /NCGR_PEP_ID=MMETSP0312-20130426/11043_1 /TAXON_ID=31354 /ORGANISM="Compsopogon coeruleus, Strain SAG 36.94" /LENGTH=430 /DNA_ID=CAMNT_0027135679 /DNA_START=189 /DNA_END=1481 /DNA_ORIENTATION=+